MIGGRFYDACREVCEMAVSPRWSRCDFHVTTGLTARVHFPQTLSDVRIYAVSRASRRHLFRTAPVAASINFHGAPKTAFSTLRARRPVGSEACYFGRGRALPTAQCCCAIMCAEDKAGCPGQPSEGVSARYERQPTGPCFLPTAAPTVSVDAGST